ncbi:MAG: hypothetical protein MJZ24_05720 [Paludibacteraceae bacterium]|nr:hypothetical protein [Candidatus Physcocola equi]MCQ2234221.1 hypothetical protein [Paludibacteraceae bacterium]
MLEKIPSILLIVLVVLAVLVIGICAISTPETLVLSDGVQPTEPNDPNMDLFLKFIYFLLVLTIIVTLANAGMSFVTKLSNDPKKSLIMVGGVAVLALLFIITYATGDGTPMHIVGYEGDQNTSGWLKMTDMFLRTSYILAGVGVLAIIFNAVAKKLNF